MTTLTADPLTSLLDRLFADAEATESDIDAAFADLSDESRRACCGARPTMPNSTGE